MATIDIQVPDIGDFDEVTVIELMVKVGDTVKAEQSLITVESATWRPKTSSNASLISPSVASARAASMARAYNSIAVRASPRVRASSPRPSSNNASTATPSHSCAKAPPAKLALPASASARPQAS